MDLIGHDGFDWTICVRDVIRSLSMEFYVDLQMGLTVHDLSIEPKSLLAWAA